MKRQMVNGVEFYTFGHFESAGGTAHGFSSRNGGVSAGCFSSLNLGFGRGDDDARVLLNFKRMAATLGVLETDMVLSDQVHETTVVHVGGTDRGKGITRASDLRRVDGLTTDEPNVVLTTFFADCVPLYFYDPKKKAVALSHAGWRGTLNQIGAVTVTAMRRRYESDPVDLLAGIGPSIGACCFEVDRPVAEAFETGLPFGAVYVAPAAGAPGKYNVDLWGLNKRILTEAGLKPGNIEMAGLCTKCHPETFYSHRASGKDRGSMAAFLQLNGERES